jgi:hypothetical protein
MRRFTGRSGSGVSEGLARRGRNFDRIYRMKRGWGRRGLRKDAKKSMREDKTGTDLGMCIE